VNYGFNEKKIVWQHLPNSVFPMKQIYKIIEIKTRKSIRLLKKIQ
jgi:hypothetical protein